MTTEYKTTDMGNGWIGFELVVSYDFLDTEDTRVALRTINHATMLDGFEEMDEDGTNTTTRVYLAKMIEL